MGSILSRTATLSVTRPVPVISQEPVDQTIIAGGSQDLYVKVTCPSTGIPDNYQWYRDDVLISGATTDTYRIPSSQTTSAMSGMYHVVISNLFGSDESRKATVLVRSRPVISDYVMPLGATVVTGRPVSISASALYGGGPYTYYWLRSNDGNYDWRAVDGVSSGTLEIAAVDAATTGYYRLVVVNSMGQTMAPPVRIRRIAPLQISNQPDSRDANGGDPMSFYAEYTFQGDLHTIPGEVVRQWFKDDLEIPGANGPSLYFDSAAESDSGRYRVRISNDAGSVMSDEAILTVSPNTPPVILTQPQPRFIHTGVALAMSLNAEGRFPINAIWRRNGARLASGIVTNKVSRHDRTATLADSGVYSVLLSNDRGTVYSDFVPVVVVNAAESTLMRPVGSSITLPMASSAAGVTFQWLKDGEPMTDSSEIKGTDKAGLSFMKLVITDAAVYTCRVTRGAESLVTGATTLIVQDQPPVITTASLPEADCRLPYSTPLAATHLPTVFKVTGLPSGLTYNATTGEISGTPSKPGTYMVEVTAGNTRGTGPKKSLSLTVTKMPAYLTGSFFSILPQDSICAGGRLELTTTDSGSFTGKLTLHTQAISLKGVLKRFLDASALVDLTGIPHKDAGPLSISVSLREHSPGDPAGEAWVNYAFDATSNQLWSIPWSKTVRPTRYEGYHTMSITADGYCYGSATVSSAGIVNYAGKLSDDSAFTASAPLSESGVSGLFFVNGGGRNHFNIPKVQFYDEQSDVVSGEGSWRKTPLAGATSYPEGFDISPSLLGLRYFKPRTEGNPGPVIMNLPVAQDNITLSLVQGVDGLYLEVRGTVSSSNAARFQTTPEARGVSVSIAPATGMFTVSGTHVLTTSDYLGNEFVVTRPFKGSGVILTHGEDNLGEGVGFFKINNLEGSFPKLKVGRLWETGRVYLQNAF